MKEKAGKFVEAGEQANAKWNEIQDKMLSIPTHPFISKTNLTRTRIALQSLKRSISEFRKLTNELTR